MRKTLAAIAGAAALLAGVETMADQGVTETEVIVGSVGELSGPFAAYGAPAAAAAQMHFDAVNAAGGIHGRTIRFIVEDSAYQMPKAMQAYNKLVYRDKVFAMLLSLGTPMNIAGFKVTTPKNIPNVSPLSAARQMLDEPRKLRFAASASYYQQLRLAARWMSEERGIGRACAMFLPSDFGKEIQQGVHDEAAASASLTYVAETTHKLDETDFVGSLQKLDAEGCEMIAVALGVRQLITVLATAKKLRLDHITFVGSSGAFHTMLAAVPGGATEGLYAAAGWGDLAARAEEDGPAAFIAAYTERTGEFPSTGALLGYAGATGFTRALETAGRDLTVQSFLSGMESLDYYDPITGNHVDYGPDDHQGSDATILSVIRDGRWTEVARLR